MKKTTGKAPAPSGDPKTPLALGPGPSAPLDEAPHLPGAGTLLDETFDPDRFAGTADGVARGDLEREALGERSKLRDGLLGEGSPDRREAVEKPGLERDAVASWEGGPGALTGTAGGIPSIGKGGMDSDEPAGDGEPAKTPQEMAQHTARMAEAAREMALEAGRKGAEAYQRYTESGDVNDLWEAKEAWREAEEARKLGETMQRASEYWREKQDKPGDKTDERPAPESEDAPPERPPVEGPEDLGTLPDVRPGVMDGSDADAGGGFVLAGVDRPDTNPRLDDHIEAVTPPEDIVRAHERPDIDPVDAGAAFGPGLFAADTFDFSARSSPDARPVPVADGRLDGINTDPVPVAGGEGIAGVNTEPIPLTGECLLTPPVPDDLIV